MNNAVATGASAAEQAQFFFHPHARIYVIWNGATITSRITGNCTPQWINERHRFGHFDLTPLNASPERVRARGTAYWQADPVVARHGARQQRFNVLNQLVPKS